MFVLSYMYFTSWNFRHRLVRLYVIYLYDIAIYVLYFLLLHRNPPWTCDENVARFHHPKVRRYRCDMRHASETSEDKGESLERSRNAVQSLRNCLREHCALIASSGWLKCRWGQFLWCFRAASMLQGTGRLVDLLIRFWFDYFLPRISWTQYVVMWDLDSMIGNRSGIEARSQLKLIVELQYVVLPWSSVLPYVIVMFLQRALDHPGLQMILVARCWWYRWRSNVSTEGFWMKTACPDTGRCAMQWGWHCSKELAGETREILNTSTRLQIICCRSLAPYKGCAPA